ARELHCGCLLRAKESAARTRARRRARSRRNRRTYRSIAHPAGQLTTAGKKRVALARALSARPELLLLDEVLAGLNPTEIERMITVIRRIRDGGIAILMIEHVMRAIMSLSDRIVVLNLGGKLAEGTPREIASNPDVIAAYLGE